MATHTEVEIQPMSRAAFPAADLQRTASAPVKHLHSSVNYPLSVQWKKVNSPSRPIKPSLSTTAASDEDYPDSWMHVIKRDGSRVPVQTDKIHERIRQCCRAVGTDSERSSPLSPDVDPSVITLQVTTGLCKDITTVELDRMAAEYAYLKGAEHPDYDRLASRIYGSDLHKQLLTYATKWVTAHILTGELPQYESLFVDKATGTVTLGPDVTFSQCCAIQHWHGIPLPKIVRPSSDDESKSDDSDDEDEGLRRGNSLIRDNELIWIVQNHVTLDAAIKQERDYYYSYFGWLTLAGSYLKRIQHGQDKGVFIDTPQFMLMRCAIETSDIGCSYGTSGHVLENVIANYHGQSQQWYTHATPTLYHSLASKNGMVSCFLFPPPKDSLTRGKFSIYGTEAKFAAVSAAAGGVGAPISSIRATGAHIHGTNGTSNGIVPMLRVWNNTARYVDQGGGKRKGALAIYMEPWHAEVQKFLLLKQAGGDPEHRCRDLFQALWIPNIFMKRVEAGESWSLMCPSICPGLDDVWGDDFDTLYLKYEREGKYVKRVPAEDIWDVILDTLPRTGGPYMLNKDECNAKSNQQNAGVIHSSNLCTEILQVTSNKKGKEEIAACNLASASLPTALNKSEFPCAPDEIGAFSPPLLTLAEHMMLIRTYVSAPKERVDLMLIYRVIVRLVLNLNRVMDVTYYPVVEARRSNARLRPIGIGVQGLADVFLRLLLPYTSVAAAELNEDISATIYYAALRTSMLLAKRDGPYPAFRTGKSRYGRGSPMANGVFQFDMWNNFKPTKRLPWDWETLRADIKLHGLRNSLLVAPMPTCTTSQLLGNFEAFYPLLENFYVRETKIGKVMVVNHHLIRVLMAQGKWTTEIREAIINNQGSIRGVAGLEPWMYEVFATWDELDRKKMLLMNLTRAWYTCQGQSVNIRFPIDPKQPQRLKESLHKYYFHCWRLGMKNWSYYLKSSAAVHAPKTAGKVTEDQHLPVVPDSITPKTSSEIIDAVFDNQSLIPVDQPGYRAVDNAPDCGIACTA